MRTCTKKQQHEIEIFTKQLHKILIFLQIFLVNVIITRFPGRVEIRDYIRPVPILPVAIIFQRFISFKFAEYFNDLFLDIHMVLEKVLMTNTL